MTFFTRPLVADTVARAMQALTRAGARKLAADAAARFPEFTAGTTEMSIPTLLGPARVIIYRAAGGSRTAPVHLNFHGGGFVMDTIDLDDALCRTLAATSGSTVINVDYAVAPQRRFPHPPQQAYDIVRWIAAHGRQSGWDGARLTVGGQSAGGALAASVSRLAMERSGPLIALQVLHYAALDLSTPTAAKRSTKAKPMLRPWRGQVFDAAYVPDAARRRDRLASPAGPADTADLTGMAPAVIVAAEHDILRDEARRYADRLDAVGALVEYREVPGADHGYDVDDDVRARESYLHIAALVRAAVTG